MDIWLQASFVQETILAQYAAIKEQYPDALLCFRRPGDGGYFVNTDGIQVAMVLRLMYEPKGPIALNACHVPEDKLEQRVAELVAAGFRVAMVEQHQTQPRRPDTKYP